jgi:integrase/recombinase XerD
LSKNHHYPQHKTEEIKYDRDVLNLYFGKQNMSKKAKTLTQQEVRKVLDHISTRKHSARNRAIVQTSFLSGMRAGEIASLKYRDIIDIEGNIKTQVLLTADMTKGSEARIVFINERLRKELKVYAQHYKPTDTSLKFFYSQKKTSNGFTAGTMTLFFYHLYRACGIEGASSHSGRRTFITSIASKGVSVRVLMSLAGHKHLATTQKYIDVNDDLLRSAVELA